MRRTRLVAAALVVVACARTRQVARVDGERRDDEPADAREVPRDQGRPPVPAAPDALLRPGGGEQVKEALAAHGLLSHRAPGDAIDDAAAAALRRFQRDKGLAATGFPDRETLRELGLDPTKIYRTADSEISR